MLGEPYVREQYEKQKFNAFKMRLAAHWLAERERARDETSQGEQIDVARSAMEAAWEAARAAKNANIIATLALGAAIVATAVSVVAIFVGG